MKNRVFIAIVLIVFLSCDKDEEGSSDGIFIFTNVMPSSFPFGCGGEKTADVLIEYTVSITSTNRKSVTVISGKTSNVDFIH